MMVEKTLVTAGMKVNLKSLFDYFYSSYGFINHLLINSNREIFFLLKTEPVVLSH